MVVTNDRVTFDLKLPTGFAWQVFWFGSLQRLPHRQAAWGIHTYFHRFSGPCEGFISPIERRLVSLTHMHLLPIGRVVGDGSRLLGVLPLQSDGHTPSAERSEHALDFSRTNTSLVLRSELNLAGPVPIQQAHPHYDAFLIRVAPTSQTPEVLVPCATLYQYFWGVSSRIARLVTTGQLEQIDRYVCDLSATGLRHSTFHLRLRSWMRDIDARYLATLLAEPYAIEAGRRIWRHLNQSAHESSGNGIQLQVIPPFPRLLNVNGFYTRRVAPNGTSTLFLSHVVSSDLAPAWARLEYSRENDAGLRSTQQGASGQAEGSSAYPRISEPGKEDWIDIEDLPSSNSGERSELPVLPGLRLRFPDVSGLDAKKIRSEVEQQEPRERSGHVRFVQGSYSAIDGVPAGVHPIAVAELNSSDAVRLDDSDASDSSEPGSDAVVHKRLSSFAELFVGLDTSVRTDGRKLQVQARFLNPYDPHSRGSEFRYFRVPSRVGRQTLAWLYSDPNEVHRKIGICVELVALGPEPRLPPRYILDFEPRQPKPKENADNTLEISNGYLAVWLTAPVDEEVLFRHLRTVIEAVAKKGNPRLTKRPDPGICSRAFKHTNADAMAIVRRVLAAKDQANSEPLPSDESQATTD